MRGGDAYYIGGGRCSVGFSVNGGFVTAGHCGSAGNATTGFNRSRRARSRAPRSPATTTPGSQVNANWTPQPWVNNYAGGNVTVAGSTEAAVGASICRSGSTTGWHCGTVQANNPTVNYPQGTVTGLTRTNACAEPGDSGGSWLVRPAGAGRHLRRLRQLHLRRHHLLPAGQRDPLRVRPDAGHQRRRHPAADHRRRPAAPATSSPRTGSLSSGGSAYQPNGSYYYSSASGAHRGCLDGPSGTDFDLYLQKWNG